jgi:hypothetical protein
MAEDVLVSVNIERGEALMRALDAADFPVVAALWLYNPDIDIWRLVLATPKANSPQKTYTEIRHIAERAGIEAPDLAQIKLVSPSDPTVTTLSRVVRVEGIGGVRFSKNMINGIYVDDAYIYRAAA